MKRRADRLVMAGASSTRILPIALMALFLMSLFALTLGGFYQAKAPVNLIPLKTIRFDLKFGGRDLLVNLIGNVVAFLPMGFLVPSWTGPRHRLGRVVLASFLLSLTIEILQGASGRRVADVDDVILNTLGGLLGYGLWRLLGGVGRSRERAGSRVG